MEYSKNFRKVLENAKIRATDDLIEPNHLLAGVIMTEECVGYKMLSMMIDMEDAKKKVAKFYKLDENVDEDEVKEKKVQLSALAEQIMLQAQLEAKRSESDLRKNRTFSINFCKVKTYRRCYLYVCKNNFR